MRRTAEDARTSDAVRKRDNWTCQRCHKWMGRSQGLHAAHIFTRSIKKTRHDLDNLVSLCYGCHSWSHRNPLEFHEWVIKRMGADGYSALMARAQRIK